MANDRALGTMIFVLSLVGIVLYAFLLYLAPLLVLEITAFLGAVMLLGILAWIGWTMATTPAPEPMTEMPPQPAQGMGQPTAGMQSSSGTETKS